MSVPKEVHHFDNDRMDWHAPDHTRLHASFDWFRSDCIRGEATPIYLYWPQSLERLRAYNQNAKIIVLLRHPVFRAYSHWRMEFARGRESLSFEEAISPVGRGRVSSATNGVHRRFSYIERGMYSQQINRVIGLFSRKNIVFLRTDDLWSHPLGSMYAITELLHISPFETASQNYVAPLHGQPGGRLQIDWTWMFRDLFAEDVHKTAMLTGLNLADWHSPDYLEPMPSEN